MFNILYNGNEHNTITYFMLTTNNNLLEIKINLLLQVYNAKIMLWLIVNASKL